VHLALAELQAVSEELSPFAIAPSCEVISAQDAVKVISSCGTNLGRDVRHRLSLAASPGLTQSEAAVEDLLAKARDRAAVGLR